MIGDVIALLSPHSGGSEAYRKGALVAIVGTLFACGHSYPTAIKMVAHQCRDGGKTFGCTLEELLSIAPEAWRADIEEAYNA